MNQLGFVEPIDSLCQGVIVTVAPAAHRRFDAGLGQALTVSNRHVLRSPVRMMYQAAVLLWLACPECLFQRIEDKVRACPARTTATWPSHRTAPMCS
jgi:hypothetical protein